MSTASIAAAAVTRASRSAGTSAAPAAAPARAPDGRALLLRTPAPRPRLTLVPDAPSRAARTPFVLMVCGLLSGGLLALLLLNTVLAQDAFALHDLEKRAAWLDARQATLSRQVAEEAAPQRLAQRAVAMGMVPSENPAFLRAADGRVLGAPSAGRAGSGAFVASPPLGSSRSPGSPPLLLAPLVSSLVAPEQPIDLLAPPAAASPVPGPKPAASPGPAGTKAEASKPGSQRTAAAKVATPTTKRTGTTQGRSGSEPVRTGAGKRR